MFAQTVAGIDLLSDDSACGMPVSAQIERLRRALNERMGEAAVRVIESDLAGLDDPERHAVLDAIVAGEPSPYVVAAGRVACVGSVDIEAVTAALN